MDAAPKHLTFISVVSRESVRISLTLAALNDLEVKTSDIQNAYRTGPCSEKVHTTLGTEFGENKGKTAIIVRALYGLATSGPSFRNYLADCMHHLGYKSCLANPDLWYKSDVKEEDKYIYYLYVLLHVDDCLCIHHSVVEGLTRLTVFQDEGCINRRARNLPWSQGQDNENKQWCDSMGNQPK